MEKRGSFLQKSHREEQACHASRLSQIAVFDVDTCLTLSRVCRRRR